ncbi:hypothetical protein [Flavobacterium chungangensis]|uniref:Uncharacterized protein n=1 Tax=Flavobacterium chungangensis TaxID=2708132 RepID=A0ABV8ZDE2_9FLAO
MAKRKKTKKGMLHLEQQQIQNNKQSVSWATWALTVVKLLELYQKYFG